MDDPLENFTPPVTSNSAKPGTLMNEQRGLRGSDQQNEASSNQCNPAHGESSINNNPIDNQMQEHLNNCSSLIGNPLAQREIENVEGHIHSSRGGAESATVTVGERGSGCTAPTIIAQKAGCSPENVKISTPSKASLQKGHLKKQFAVRTPTEENTLFTMIKNGQIQLQQVADKWIEHYKADRDSGLRSIMDFFINASGCDGKITIEMLNNMEIDAIIEKITAEFDEESGEYPIIIAGPEWKKFPANFCYFVETLVKQCQQSILYDQFLMDKVISFLAGLSGSKVQAFRHTATLAVMKVITALVDVALTVLSNLENTSRQYEAKRKNNRDKRTEDRLQTMLSKRQELEDQINQIQNMLTSTFKSVIVHRYCDTDSEITEICVAEMGIWMNRFPQHFLDDSHLEYIGWALDDQDPDVILKCCQVLQPFYASEEFEGKLEKFTSDIKDRIISLALDKDDNVAVGAIQLISSIQKYQRKILSDEDCKCVYELVFSSRLVISLAAGELFNESLFTYGETSPAPLRTQQGKKRLANTPLIRRVVQFLINSKMYARGSHLVDSLLDRNNIMKDWECMTDLLLEEPGPGEEPLNDREETCLIQLMTCCVSHAANGVPPGNRHPNLEMKSGKGLKQAQEDRIRITKHFITALPLLLEKYIEDAHKTAVLLHIPELFVLEMYTTLHEEEELEWLLYWLQIAVDSRTDTQLMETSARTLRVLCNEDVVIYPRCNEIRKEVIDRLVNQVRQDLIQHTHLLAGDEDKKAALMKSLAKVSIFWGCHDLGPWNIWDLLFDVIRDANDVRRSMPPEVVEICISACFCGIMWEVNQLEDNSGPVTWAMQQEQLRHHLDSYFLVLTEMVATPIVPLLQEKAYNSICDLLVAFCEETRKNPLLRPLFYEPDEVLQKALNDFVQSHVFVEQQDEEEADHKKLEKLDDRRNYLVKFCKLIAFSILPIKMASGVFCHLFTFRSDCGKIIDNTLERAKDMNRVIFARTLVVSLTIPFGKLRRDAGGRIDRQSEEFLAVKELASLFVKYFGSDVVENREAMTALHRDGIIFANNRLKNGNDPTEPPPNLAFLEVLAEFTCKLHGQDKRVMLQILDRILPMRTTSSRDDWQPHSIYRNCLVQGESNLPPH